MRKSSVILLSVLALAIVSIIGYFFMVYELKTESKETRLQSWEVIKNKYLAMEHYLEKNGRVVDALSATKFFRTLPRKTPEQTTVILLGKIDYLTDDQADVLFDWVLEGGTVIAAVVLESDTLSDFGIAVSNNATQYSAVSSLYENSQKIAELEFARNFSIQSMDEDVEIHRQAFVKKKDGATYVELKYGDGKIHLLSSIEIWENHNIDKKDHAWLLDVITSDDVVIVKLSNQQDSGLNKVWRALIDNFLYTMIFLVLLILLILWNQGMRSGAIEESASRDRRTLSEYLKALANFHQQEKGYGALIMLLQQEITTRMNMRYHAYASLSQDEKNKQLSQLTQIPVEAISVLMSSNIDGQKISTLQFIKRVAELQKIRNQL